MNVTETVDALFRSIDREDAAGIAALLTEDAAMADEASRGWIRGKAEIRGFVGTTFDAVDAITSTLSDVVIRESADHATATFTLIQSYVLNGQPGSLVAPTAVTLERTSGNWLIAVMQSCPLADA